MRTKTLLLTAALSAAGVATSMAQVYSVNAVGYVNTTLLPGLNLVSNPLDAANNTIGSLFAGLPAGAQVFKFNGSTYTTATMDEFSGTFVPESAAATTVVPGEGVFVRNPTAGNLTVTFVGEVMQGNLSNPLPAGLSIRSSQVPQAGTASALGFPGSPGDQIFQYDAANQRYVGFTFDEFASDWTPALQPLKVGEAFFLRKVAAANWTRTFSVNQ